MDAMLRYLAVLTAILSILISAHFAISTQFPCAERMIIDASSKRLELGSAAETLRRCGLLAIAGAVPMSVVEDFHYHANKMLSPLLESRSRLKSRPERQYDDLPGDLQTEGFLSNGEVIRERSPGRLDLLLPHAMPFNHTAITLNRFAMEIMASVFDGQAFELKSAHTVVSLPGAPSQQWHRDDSPLFPAGGGLFSRGEAPVYAINAFVSLTDVTIEMGPTEYLVGSHQKSNGNVESIIAKNHEAAVFSWPAGSLVLMDYRLAHSKSKCVMMKIMCFVN